MNNVHLIPILKDNYVFIIEDSKKREALVVDPGEAEPVIHFLTQKNITPTGILVTHQHADHTAGVFELKSQYQIPVWGPRGHHEQIPELDTLVGDESHFYALGESVQVFELPGHTLGHVAYYFEGSQLLFSGDVLFGLGCGRLFEGTYEQAFQSLSRLKKLPPSTRIYCAHEYTEANLRFSRKYSNLLTSANIEALKLYEEALKSKRSIGQPSVPLILDRELAANPFLQAQTLDEFKNLRQLRNSFS